MRISLSALEHLGINLYSNVPAVLSEIVANAWDADARKVRVKLDKATETIVIDDDGAGMDRDAVVDRFLTVGFQRRNQSGGDKTPGGRVPMGRKGIGKLSIFSVAKTATIYTAMGKDRTAFKMDRDEIRKYATGNALANYKPEELKSFPTDFRKGTRIVLSGLSKSLSGMTLKGLKRRIARRFSVIGSKHSFPCHRRRGSDYPTRSGISRCHRVSVDVWKSKRIRQDLYPPREGRGSTATGYHLPTSPRRNNSDRLDRNRLQTGATEGRRRRQPESPRCLHARKTGPGKYPGHVR